MDGTVLWVESIPGVRIRETTYCAREFKKL